MQIYEPSGIEDLNRLNSLLTKREPFTFVRFSDGEIEILRNRFNSICFGKTFFRGKIFTNNFPVYDEKTFDPAHHLELRRDLLAVACFSEKNFFKGIPTSHNNALIDREFLVRLNGGMSRFITFSDLLMNSNYNDFLKNTVSLFDHFKNIYVIANFRAKLKGILSNGIHCVIGDNLFMNYEETLAKVLHDLIDAPKGSLVLSSASSLSNIVGMKIFQSRSDITFIDVGTSINHLLSLSSKTRAYHSNKLDFYGLKNKISRDYKIKW